VVLLLSCDELNPVKARGWYFFLTRLKHSFLTFGWGDDASRWPFQLHSLHHFWSWECPGLHGKMIVDELYYVSQFFMGQSKHQSVNHSKLLAAPMLRRFQKPHLLAKCDLWHRSMSAWSYNDDLYLEFRWFLRNIFNFLHGKRTLQGALVACNALP